MLQLWGSRLSSRLENPKPDDKANLEFSLVEN